MKLQNKLIFAVATTVLSSAAFAAQIDFRHEWKSESHDEASRVKLGTGFNIDSVENLKANIGLEMKFASEDRTKTLENTELTETELDLGLTYTMGQWQIKPGMPISLTPTKRTFKPQIRIVYNTDFGLQTGLRYRHEFANFSEAGSGDTDSKTGEKINRPQKSKITFTAGYKIKSLPNLKLNFETNYVKSWNNVKQFDNKDWEYDAGIVVGYQLGDWRPYAEIWSIDESSSSGQRQAKYRLGIKYAF